MSLSPRTEPRVRVRDIFQCPRGARTRVVESEVSVAARVCLVLAMQGSGGAEMGRVSRCTRLDG